MEGNSDFTLHREGHVKKKPRRSQRSEGRGRNREEANLRIVPSLASFCKHYLLDTPVFRGGMAILSLSQVGKVPLPKQARSLDNGRQSVGQDRHCSIGTGSVGRQGMLCRLKLCESICDTTVRN